MEGKPARSVDLAEHEKEAIQHLCLLTMKPVIYVANVQNLILLNLIAILMSKRWLKQHQTCSLVWLQYQLRFVVCI